ncbi:para-aminobenzoate synthetase [Arcanobacterium pluranimalium]|uniref:hypothetical protein n=1 Tax=Arcanobacterium pluranimalium TaxID=108028 RepID=UPI001956D4EC|nr:hypothetical protein [Arcanobacterium pluranimalium]MBM7824339.1 para-aminobenzoate synthetase [Arcanobacterium pluranimalium]
MDQIPSEEWPELPRYHELFNELRRQHERYTPTPFFVAVDGRSGSGKTTLAHTLAADFHTIGISTAIFEVEEWAAGWFDLAGAVDRVRALIHELRDTSGVTTSRWDWEANVWRAAELVAPASLYLVTGCGSGATGCDFTVWVEADARVRKQRVQARDSYDWSEYWQVWADQETAIYEHFNVTQIADIRLSTDQS